MGCRRGGGLGKPHARPPKPHEGLRRGMTCPECGSRPSTRAGTGGPARVVPARSLRDTLYYSSIIPLLFLYCSSIVPLLFLYWCSIGGLFSLCTLGAAAGCITAHGLRTGKISRQTWRGDKSFQGDCRDATSDPWVPRANREHDVPRHVFPSWTPLTLPTLTAPAISCANASSSGCEFYPALEVRVTRRAGEGDHVPDIRHARQKHEQPLEP